MAEAADSESVSGAGNDYDQRILLSAILIYVSPAPCLGFMFFLVSMYLTPYAAHYIIGTPHLTPFFVLCYMVAAVSTALFWARLATRYDKKQLWVFSMTLTAFRAALDQRRSTS